jgi:hypothetical protein
MFEGNTAVDGNGGVLRAFAQAQVGCTVGHAANALRTDQVVYFQTSIWHVKALVHVDSIISKFTILGTTTCQSVHLEHQHLQ